MDLTFQMDGMWCYYPERGEEKAAFSGLMSAKYAEEKAYAFRKKSPNALRLQTFKVSLKDKKGRNSQQTQTQGILLNPDGKKGRIQEYVKINLELHQKKNELQTIFGTRSQPQLFPQMIPTPKKVIVPVHASKTKRMINFQYMGKDHPDFKNQEVEKVRTFSFKANCKGQKNQVEQMVLETKATYRHQPSLLSQKLKVKQTQSVGDEEDLRPEVGFDWNNSKDQGISESFS